MDFVFKILTPSDGTNRYLLKVGLTDIVSTDPTVNNGMYVSYSDNVNSGNWTYTCINSAVATTTNSSTAVTSGWHHLLLTINDPGTSVSFEMDGVSLGAAITTNITSTMISPAIIITAISGTIGSAFIEYDMIYATQAFTTAR